MFIDDCDMFVKFNISRWFEKFFYWRCTLVLFDFASRDSYEVIYIVIVIYKGIKDVDKYVDDLCGIDDWIDFVK